MPSRPKTSRFPLLAAAVFSVVFAAASLAAGQPAADFAKPLRVCAAAAAAPPPLADFASDNENIYFRTSPSVLGAYSIRDLSVRWINQAPAAGSATLLLGASARHLYEISYSNGTPLLAAYDRESGLLLSQNPLSYADVATAGLVFNRGSGLPLPVLKDSPLNARILGASSSRLLLEDPGTDALYLADLEFPGQEPRFLLRIGDPTAFLTVSETAGIIGRASGEIIGFEGSEVLWKLRTGGRIERLLYSGGLVLALSADNFLYLIDWRTGDIERKVRLGLRNAAQPEIRGDLLFVVGIEQDLLLVVDTRNARIVNRFTLSDETRFFTGGLKVVSDGIVVSTNAGLLKIADRCS